jgi:hypothetical protein
MNSGLDGQLGLAKAKGEKPKRAEVISVLLGRFERERVGRGVESWKKGEAVRGMELVGGGGEEDWRGEGGGSGEGYLVGFRA